MFDGSMSHHKIKVSGRFPPWQQPASGPQIQPSDHVVNQTASSYQTLIPDTISLLTYRKRSQVETVMNMIKRRQGNFVRGKTDSSRHKELHLIVLTHNVMILWWA